MVQQVTSGIKISVETSFEGTFYKNYKVHFAFGYKVTIENQSKDAVQLNSRHWRILDALNNEEIVHGEGVIGKQPVLQPGEYHTYNSG
jgi:ApaG protein